ncbi:hypothetical protein JX266_014520, partial [Neoarthrinium moseri]
FDEIDGFLGNVTSHIIGGIQQAMQSASAVKGVVRNMRRLLPGRVDRNVLEDMTRLFGEVDTFKTNIKKLLGSRSWPARAAAGPYRSKRNKRNPL